MSAEQGSTSKKKYTSPKLVNHGHLTRLTAGGSGTMQEMDSIMKGVVYPDTSPNKFP
jgi:hypothetical protein